MCLFKKQVSFTKFEIPGVNYRNLLLAQGWEIPMGMLDTKYFYTDAAGWASVLSDMMFSSLLYAPETFDCEDYALKAVVVATEKYGLNSLGLVVGKMPQGWHGWNFFYVGDRFMMLEPNLGFNLGYFELGENGYVPYKVLV